MTSIKLSIIIPCYNCANTIEEAVESIFLQTISFSFEVIMVDDGSSDNTFLLLKTLQQRYSNISIYQNDQNYGGGYTRNRGASYATGEILLFFDADDLIINDSFLNFSTVFDTIKKHPYSVFYYDEQWRFTSTIRSKKIIQFESSKALFYDFFLNKKTFQSNFIVSKELFISIGEYAEHHHFDSQSFGLRTALINPLSYPLKGFIYASRFFSRKINQSYYERAHMLGHIQLNQYFLMEDCLHVLSDDIVTWILHFNVFNNCSEVDFIQTIKAKAAQDPSTFFNKNYNSYLCINGYAKYLDEHVDNTDIAHLFRTAVFLFNQKQYSDSLNLYNQLSQKGVITPITTYNIIRNHLALSGQYKPIDVTTRALELVKDISQLQPKPSLRPPFFKKVIEKIVYYLNIK